jgi:hypothetical protein
MIGMNNIKKKIILYVLEHEVIENGYKMQVTLNIQNAEHNKQKCMAFQISLKIKSLKN